MVRTNATTDYIGMPNRNAQISLQIHTCLTKSITPEVAEVMVNEKDKFMFGTTPDGPSYLMALIEACVVKTKATATQLRLKIASATALMEEAEFNITAFDHNIKSLINDLSAHGERTEDLFAHLTKAFKAVPDTEFHAYISSKIDAHNDGSEPMTADQLMDKAKNKCEEMEEAKVWSPKPSKEAAQLVTLTAQLQQIKEDHQRLQSKLQTQRNQDQRALRPGGRAARRGTTGSTGSSTKPDKWSWKTVRGNTNQTTKEFEGKTYHWCPLHKAWTLHTNEECRLKQRQHPEAVNMMGVHSQLQQDEVGAFDDL